MKILTLYKNLTYALFSVALTSVAWASEVILPDIDPSILSETPKNSLQSGYVYDENGNLLGDSQSESTEPLGERNLIINSPEINKKKLDQAPIGAVQRSTTIMNNSPPQYNFQGCDPFTLGTGNQYQLTQLEQVCSNTYSPIPVKLESLILSQTQGTNFDLAVYFYNHETDTAEFIGGSANPDNQDEIFSEVVPAGNYILYGVPQTAGTTIEFIIGALGWENYDAYESNDTVSQATQVDGSAGNYILTGNSDNQNDLDYFLYTAPQSEDSAIVRLNSSTHILQIYDGSSWANIPANSTATISLDIAGGSFYARVFYDPSQTADPLINYELVFSRPATNVTNYSITGDVQPGWFPGTEVANYLNFSGTAIDNGGNPVPYANNVGLSIRSNEAGYNNTFASVNENGSYSQSLYIPNCTGTQLTSLRWDYANEICWEIDYQYDEYHTWAFGIGSLDDPRVRYYHICSATLRSNINFQNCQ